MRNAALQLFSALSLRVVGQVKVRGGEGFNRVAVGEVEEAQLPGLLDLLLARLEQEGGPGLADPAQGRPGLTTYIFYPLYVHEECHKVQEKHFGKHF